MWGQEFHSWIKLKKQKLFLLYSFWNWSSFVKGILLHYFSLAIYVSAYYCTIFSIFTPLCIFANPSKQTFHLQWTYGACLGCQLWLIRENWKSKGNFTLFSKWNAIIIINFMLNLVKKCLAEICSSTIIFRNIRFMLDEIV